MEKPDYDIVRECLAGDRESFAKLVTRYKNLVASVIYGYGIDSFHVHDLSQEVFIKAYRSLDTYSPGYAFSTWLMRITTSVCLDWFRKRKNDPLPVENVPETASREGSPEEKYIQKTELQELRNAIQSLPEKYRVPLVLFHQQKLSYNEIQQVLNQPLSIIKNRLHRGRNMLRQLLHQSMEVEES